MSVLQWLLENAQVQEASEKSLVMTAAEGGHVAALKWLACQSRYIRLNACLLRVLIF